MANFVTDVKQLFDHAKSAPAKNRASLFFPKKGNSPFTEHQHYLQILINEMYLAKKETQTAEPHLTMALQRVINLRQISDFLLELDLLQQRATLENWAHAKKLSTYLNQSDGFITQGNTIKRVIGATKGNSVKELQRVLADPVLGLPGSWSWLAAQASLGRLYLETNQLDSAREVYQKLIQYPDKMRGARAGLDMVNKGALS